MKTKEIINRARGFAKPFRVSKGKDFRLKDVDPGDTLEFTKEADKPRAKEALAMGVTALAELQDKLYAQDKWAVLLIFQAMDAAGKDGAIKHVMSGVNPQGCEVYSFKSPSSEDLDHDYLWRCMKCLPNRGHIGIFNRSYYEEVLVVRVHPEFLAKQKLPAKLVGKTNLGGTVRRHSQLRTISDEKWRGRAEIFPSCFKKGTETTIPGPNRRSAEKLEVLIQ
jgi:polyphosphate kinase 2 (PPK2 family)